MAAGQRALYYLCSYPTVSDTHGKTDRRKPQMQCSQEMYLMVGRQAFNIKTNTCRHRISTAVQDFNFKFNTQQLI